MLQAAASTAAATCTIHKQYVQQSMQDVMQNTVHYKSNDPDARQNMRFTVSINIPPASTRQKRFVGVRGGGSPPVEARRILLRSRSILELGKEDAA